MPLAAARLQNRPLSRGEHDFYVLMGAVEPEHWTMSRPWKIALRTCIALATLAAMAFAVVLIRQSESSNDVQAVLGLLMITGLVAALLWAATLDWCYSPA